MNIPQLTEQITHNPPNKIATIHRIFLNLFGSLKMGYMLFLSDVLKTNTLYTAPHATGDGEQNEGKPKDGSIRANAGR